MAWDQQLAIAAIQQRLADNRAQLSSGVSRMDENGRSISYNLTVIQANIARDEAELQRLTGGRPTLRRLLVTSPSKGL